MSYTPYYPNGWQSGKTGNTPIIPEALQHMERGIMDSAPDGFGLGRKGVGTQRVECDTEAKLDLLVFNGFWAYRNSEVPLIPGDDFTKFVKGFTLAYNDYCATQIGFCTANGRCIIREMYGETPGMWGKWGYPPAVFGAAAASHSHKAGDITGGTIPIERGGTGATNAAEARTKLGITRASLGAAPDGYGLGELGKSNPDIICATKSQLDEKMLNGFWSYGNEAEPLIPGDAYTYFVKGIALAYSTGAVTQIGVCNANGGIISREFYQPPEQEGKWDDWCYLNPPMTVGVEYRTTERWRDKTVYTKVVSFGTLPNNASKSVTHNANATKVLRVTGTFRNETLTLPYHYDGDKIDIFASATNVYAIANHNASSHSAYLQIWYTKD